MTRLAMYESGPGKKELQITRYFPGQYIKTKMFWSFVCGTIAFAIIFALGALYNVETFMMDIFTMDIMKLTRNFLLIYSVFIAIYLKACHIYLNRQYGRYKVRVSKYLQELKELYRSYVEVENQNL